MENKMCFINMVECFKIQLLSFDREEDILDIKKGKGIFTVPCVPSKITWNPTIIVADPFLFVKNEKLYLFYESKAFFSPGVIMMTSTVDLKNWSKPVVVLKESFHLSYPWVFEEEGKIYMIPETGSDKSIRLYEAVNDDLTEFRLVKKLLEHPKNMVCRIGYGDTSIYKKEGKYYLMTMLQHEEPVNILELYVSDDLQGPYIPHPCSPIAKDNKSGRDAGCWLELGGKLLRFSQDCVRRYGDNVNVSEITKLSPTEYEEHLIQECIIPTDVPFYKEGGHQFNVVQFMNKKIVATDAKEYHSLLLHRIIRKLLKK